MSLTYKLWTPAVVTGTVSPTVVSLNVATVSAAPQSSVLSPGQVAIGLNSVLALASAQTASVTPGGAILILSSASLVSTIGNINSIPGTVHVVISVANLSTSVGVVVSTPGGVVLISLDSATVDFIPGLTAVIPGEVTVSLSTGILDALVSASTIVPGYFFVLLNSAEINSDVQDIGSIPGVVVIPITTATISVLDSLISIIPGQVLYLIQSAEITTTTPVSSILPGLVTIDLDSVLLTLYGYNLFNPNVPDGIVIYFAIPRYSYSPRLLTQFVFDQRKLNLVSKAREVYFADQRSIIKVRYSMATVVQTNGQSLAETRTWYLDFGPDLPTGVTVISAVAIHTPPYVTTAATLSVVVSSPSVRVTLSGLDVIGLHYLDVQATLSDAQVSEMRLVIPVEF